MGDEALYERVRNRVITSLYTGHREAGDRLPSVRQLGRELGAAPRAVLRVYRALEQEGLVDIRPRSGVYLADQRRMAPDLPEEASEWVASRVLVGAWQRRIPLGELPELLRRCTASVPLRCACVDAVEDVRVALCHELQRDLGLEAVPVRWGGGERDGGGSRDTYTPDTRAEQATSADPAGGGGSSIPDAIEEALDGVDLVVCTTFHGPEVGELARRRDLPLVVLSIDPVALERVSAGAAPEDLVFVVVDPAFEPRLRAAFGDAARVLTVDELGAADRRVEDRTAAPDERIVELVGAAPDARIVFSPAAARRFRSPEADGYVPTVPVLSLASVRDLCRWIVRLNLEREG